MYDVAIIGGGLAGLSSAYHLEGLSICVLEKEDRLGGRVATRSRNGITYELGAVFRYDRDCLPFEFFGSPLVTEKGPIGLYHNGSLFLGDTVLDCMMNSGLSAESRAGLVKFRGGEGAGFLLDDESGMIEAFFKVIHPGNYREYVEARHRDALVRFCSDHYMMGNRELIEAFAARISAEVRTGCEALSVADKGSFVEIACGSGIVTARTALVTAPAPVAAKIVSVQSGPCARFLGSLRCGSGLIAAVALEGADLPDFSYIVTTGHPVNTIIKNKTERNDVDMIYAYFVAENADCVRDLPEREILSDVLDLINRCSGGSVTAGNVLFSEMRRWDMVGPVISDEAYAGWDNGRRRPSGRVFLAGDYTFVQTGDPMPYGMTAAILSGRQAAADVRDFLHRAGPKAFSPEYLTRSTLYRITSQEPQFIGFEDECDIAYYGLILQSEYDPAMEQYLLRSSADDLWEYQRGYGATSADSALVIEGLLESGADKGTLKKSVQRLFELFYSGEKGAFATVTRGRAGYWRGVSVETTAHVAYLVSRIAPDDYADEVPRCEEFIRRSQEEDGSWRGKWFPSIMIPTYYAVRFLGLRPRENAESLARAEQFLLSSQLGAGSWFDSVIDTSAAMLALRAIGSSPAARQRAADWLVSRRKEDGWPGEPVLYFWFEEEHSDDRIFFSTQDKGRITTAWAKLALK